MSGTQNVFRPGYEDFIGTLRSALHYLYDPVHLRRSPLADLFIPEGTADRASALQRVLIEAILALKPGETEPPQSATWGIYDMLSLQYIRQFSRDVVATQLGISERQMRREQRLALEALAQWLWNKYALDSLPDAGSAGAAAEESPEPHPENTLALSAELGWLKNPGAEELETLQSILNTVQALAQPLADQHGLILHFQLEAEAEELPAPQVAIRSILLTILNALIPRVEGEGIVVKAGKDRAELCFDVSCRGLRPAQGETPGPEGQENTGLEAARQVAVFYGASLIVEQALPTFHASLRFPAPKQTSVLVIDDNADWLEMLKRYVAGSRYHVIAGRDPRTAAALAEKVQPAIIFLDVMMPNVDGWQVLGELRQAQATHSIPIVVCTVLPLAHLALSLGVNAFLQKPVTQDQFLGLLDRLLSRQ